MESVERQIRELSEQFSGTLALAVKQLGTGEQLGINEHRIMPTASVIKLPILVALHRAAAAGHLSFNDRVIFGSQHDSIGSGVLNKLRHGVEMSLADAATLMIIISDNVATNMCLEALGGFEYVNESMRELGLVQTTMFMRLGDPSRGLDGRNHYVTTADEMCRLLTMLAGGSVVSADASREMLRLLRRQQQRDKLARELPWNELNMLPDPMNNWVANKGGTYIGGVRNDVAIMHGPAGEAGVAVFCEGGNDRSGKEAVNLMAGIGKLLWESCRHQAEAR